MGSHSKKCDLNNKKAGSIELTYLHAAKLTCYNTVSVQSSRIRAPLSYSEVEVSFGSAEAQRLPNIIRLR